MLSISDCVVSAPARPSSETSTSSAGNSARIAVVGQRGRPVGEVVVLELGDRALEHAEPGASAAGRWASRARQALETLAALVSPVAMAPGCPLHPGPMRAGQAVAPARRARRGGDAGAVRPAEPSSALSSCARL